MLVLGIETTGDVAGLAIAGPDGITAADWFAHERRLTPLLFQHLRDLLAHAGLTLGELNGIAVSAGPGSFTGIRIGITAAKSLAYALEVPVVRVNTLRAFAAESPGLPEGPRIVLSPGVRSEYFVETFMHTHGRELESLEAGRCLSTPAAVAAVRCHPGPVAVLAAARADGGLLGELGDQVLWKTSRTAPQGPTIAALGRAQLLRGERDDVLSMAPCYLRGSTPEQRLLGSVP